MYQILKSKAILLRSSLRSHFGLFILMIACLPPNTVTANVDSLLHLLRQDTKQPDSLILAVNQEIQGFVYNAPVKALHYARTLDSIANPTEPTLLGEVKNTLGLAHYVNENYDEAIATLLVALRSFEKAKGQHDIAEVYNSLASVYQVRKEVDTSVDYFNKALDIFQQLQDTTWIASVSANLGAHLMEYDRLDKAGQHLKRALSLFTELDHKIYMGFAQLNLGSLRIKEERYRESISLFESSLDNVPYDINPLVNAVANSGLGQAHLNLGNNRLAERYLKKGYQIAEDIQHAEQLKSSTGLLAQYFEKTGNYELAFEHQKEWSALQDSFLNAQQDSRMLDALKKYESEKKEQEILLLSAENEIKDLRIQKSRRNLVLSLLMLLGISGLAFQFYRTRRKTQQLNTTLQDQKKIISTALKEKEILLKEIHHRVKNNLQVISSLLGIQSRQIKDKAAIEALKKSRSRVQSMSLIHQDLYKKDNLTAIGVRAYLEKLAHGLFATYNISEESISLTANIEDLMIDVDTIIPLGLVINELLSNALKYAFPDGCGRIELILRETTEGLLLRITDDGIGIKDVDNIQYSESFGYDLIQSLIDKLEGDISITVDNGTSIDVLIKEYKLVA